MHTIDMTKDKEDTLLQAIYTERFWIRYEVVRKGTWSLSAINFIRIHVCIYVENVLRIARYSDGRWIIPLVHIKCRPTFISAIMSESSSGIIYRSFDVGCHRAQGVLGVWVSGEA
jgi:hypothetical protein